MRFFTLILFASVFINLAGCTYIFGEQKVIANRDTDYLKAKSIPPLKIPPGFSSSTMTARYPISERSYPPSSYRPDLTPPELNPAS